ncbi:MAG: hypothetical protein PHW25_17065 [Zoogloea sp.]|jgi:Tfp pilus assembly protein PilX|uniref:hypothetical protein n=1 Tax=Zoogloea sp. TaxID=49181 RepID=UPI00260834F8|nr:hypothetical protein [Zoogloea sp.]MDD3328795.1 hypothetical protein [Zoogloea sp.]
MRLRTHPFPIPHPSRSRGSVLAVVLVVLVVMMLGGVSLLRSVDTSALLSGNLAFKRDSVNRTSVGLNKAFETMQKAEFIANEASDAGCNPGPCTAASTWLQLNYSPRLLETDANGVPVILKNKTEFDAKFGTIKPVSEDGQEVRFLIERMCTDYGPSDESKCSVSDRYELGGSYRQDKPGSISLPLYRVTIRSDGVRNTQTYVQATVTTRVK